MIKTWNIYSQKYFENTFDELSSWIDFMTFSLNRGMSKNFENKILKNIQLNDTNTNLAFTLFFEIPLTITYTKTQIWDWYTFFTNYNELSIPLFQYVKCDLNQITHFKRHWQFILYWAFFRLLSLDYFSSDFINTLYTFIWEYFFSRIDFRIDWLSYNNIIDTPPTILVIPNIRSNKSVKLYQKNNYLESWEAWKREYKTIFIRYYNKRIELEKNLKWSFLYNDILKKFKSFHRLEYEFWQKYLKWYQFKDLDLLLSKIYNTTWFSFSNFSWCVYQPKEDLNFDNVKLKNNYINNFIKMGNNLYKNWLNPFELLLLSNIIDKNLLYNIQKHE